MDGREESAHHVVTSDGHDVVVVPARGHFVDDDVVAVQGDLEGVRDKLTRSGARSEDTTQTFLLFSRWSS